MRIVRFNKDGTSSYGVLDGGLVRRMVGSPFGPLLLAEGGFAAADVRLLAPVEPSKVVAVGLNYVDHARELKMDVPDEPILFIKPATSVVGPDAAVVYPDMSDQVDYEAELVVVIKRTARNVGIEDAAEHILGYTCGNDVTARDLQRKDVQWTRAKSFDTFSPLGPWIETEFDPAGVAVELRLNGEVRQSSSTKNMIFSPIELVSFVSRVMTLLPGDVIMTGTPPGVGPMAVGDTVQVAIEGLGWLTNTVVAAG